MKQTKTGNRVVVIGGSVSAAGKVARREPTVQRATTRRIVVIKDGEVVGRRTGR